MRQNPHVRICGGPGSATTLVLRGVFPRSSHGLHPRKKWSLSETRGNSTRAFTGIMTPGLAVNLPQVGARILRRLSPSLVGFIKAQRLFISALVHNSIEG